MKRPRVLLSLQLLCASAALLFAPPVSLSAETTPAQSAATGKATTCQGLRRSDFAYVQKDEGRAVQAALHALYKEDPRYQEESGTSGRPLSDGIIGPVTLSWLKYFCGTQSLSGENLAPLVIETLLAPPAEPVVQPVPPPQPAPPVVIPAPKAWSYFMLSAADMKALAAPGVVSGELKQWDAALADVVDVRYADRKSLRVDLDSALAKASGAEVEAYKEELIAAAQTVKTLHVSERSLIRLEGRLAETSLVLARSELLENEYADAAALRAAAQAAGISDKDELEQIVAKADAASYIVLRATALRKPLGSVQPLPPQLLTMLQPLVGRQFPSRTLMESALRRQFGLGSVSYGEAMLACPYEFDDCRSKQRVDAFKATDALFTALLKNIQPLIDSSTQVGNVELPLTSSELERLFGDSYFTVNGRVPTRVDVATLWQEQKGSMSREARPSHVGWMRLTHDETAAAQAVRFKQALRAHMLFHRYAADIESQIQIEKTDTREQVAGAWTGDGCGCVQDGLAGVVYGFYPYGKGAVPPAPPSADAQGGAAKAPPPRALDFSVLSTIGLYGLSFDDAGHLIGHSSGRAVDDDFVDADTIAFVREAGKWETRIDWVLHKNWSDAPADKAALFKQLHVELTAFLTRPLPGMSTRFWAAVALPFPTPKKNRLLTTGDGVTLHFENYPDDEASVKHFNEFVVALQERLNAAGPHYTVNIVVPARKLGAGIYGLKNLSALLRGRHPSYETAFAPPRSADDMLLLVLMEEPVAEMKLSLRAAIEGGLSGAERVFVLRHTVPVVGDALAGPQALSDQIIYARDNFGGVGLWPIPIEQNTQFNDETARIILASDIEDAGRVIADHTLGWFAPTASNSMQAWVCEWRNWIRLLFIVSLLGGGICYAIVRTYCSCSDGFSRIQIGTFVGLALATISFVLLLFFDPDMVEVSQSRLFWMGMIAITALSVGLPYVLKLKKQQNPSRNDYRGRQRVRARVDTSPVSRPPAVSLPPPQAFGDAPIPVLQEVTAASPRDALWHAQLREALAPLWQFLNEAPRDNQDFDFTRQRLRELAQPLASYLQTDESASTRAYEQAATAVERMRNYLERDKEADPVTRAHVRALIKAVRVKLSVTDKEKEHAKMRQTLAALGGRLEQEARELGAARRKIDGLMRPLWAHIDAIDAQAQYEADAGRIRELGDRLFERKQANER